MSIAEAPASLPSRPPKRPLWQRLLGLRRREGRFLRFRPTRWGWALLLMVFFGGAGAGFMEYSMQPKFCLSCHLMEPYYHAWAESTHKDVNCTLCHFEPGFKGMVKGKFEASTQAVKFITGTYGSKPHAQISNRSCLRDGCHEHRILDGKIKWPVPSERGGNVVINFDHTPHLSEERRGKELRCVSCHSQMVQGQHIAVTTDTCFLCHFKGFEHGRNEQAMGGCESCHDAPRHEVRLVTGTFEHGTYIHRGVTCENCHSNSIYGDGEVPKQVCWVCHNQPRQVMRYDEPDFLHEMHVTDHKVECASCHIKIEHNLNAVETARLRRAPDAHLMANGGSCGQCHEAMHGGPAELYRGTGGFGVPDMASPMFRAQVDCIACHRTIRQPDLLASVAGQTYLAGQEACDYCHGVKYQGELEQWKRSIDQHLARARAALEQSQRGWIQLEPDDPRQVEVQRLLDEAEHNIRLVSRGRGVHNINYATALLNAAIERCRQVKRILSDGQLAGGAS